MLKNKKYLIIIPAVVLLLVFIYVQKKGEKNKVVPLPAGVINTTVEEKKEEIKTGELKIEDLAVGEGKEATVGKKVVVNYVGTLADGTKFDSSYDRGILFAFNLGAGEVIKGWDLGVTGMKVGGKRRLIIPPGLGYGEKSTDPLIPPNSTLIFEIELEKVE